MHDHDRDAILARRALYISAALAGLACTTHETPDDPEPDGVEQSSFVEVDRGPDPAGPPSDGERPSWAAIMAAAPALDVPKGLSKTESELLSNLESRFRGQYTELEKVWNDLPTCRPSEAECEAWAGAIELIIRNQPDFGPLCGWSAEVTGTFIERHDAHERYLVKLGEMLLAELDRSAEAFTDPADVAAWQRERKRMDEPMARPCLSCMAPGVDPITTTFRFAGGESSLSGQADALKFVAAVHQGNRKARLIVRGHADPSESDPVKLAQLRAEAVAAALIDLGVPKRDIEIRGYADALPITRDPAEAEVNRRVDFEVIPP